jgi:hypothetical protein
MFLCCPARAAGRRRRSGKAIGRRSKVSRNAIASGRFCAKHYHISGAWRSKFSKNPGMAQTAIFKEPSALDNAKPLHRPGAGQQ